MMQMRKLRSQSKTDAPEAPAPSGTSVDLKTVGAPDQAVLDKDFDFVFRAAAKAKTRIITTEASEASAPVPQPAAVTEVAAAPQNAAPRAPVHVPAHQRTRVLDQSQPVFAVQSGPRSLTPSFVAKPVDQEPESEEPEGLDLGLAPETAPVDSTPATPVVPDEATLHRMLNVMDGDVEHEVPSEPAAVDQSLLKTTMAVNYEPKLIEDFASEDAVPVRSEKVHANVDDIADALAANIDIVMADMGMVDLARVDVAENDGPSLLPTLWLTVLSAGISMALIRVGFLLPAFVVVGVMAGVLIMAFALRVPALRRVLGLEVADHDAVSVPIGSINDTRDPFYISPFVQRVLRLLPKRRVVEAA